MKNKDTKSEDREFSAEARQIASEVFKKEYSSGLIAGLCIGAAFGVIISIVSRVSE